MEDTTTVAHHTSDVFIGGDTVKVLVTGATGFIGRSLSEILIEKGYEVYGLVRFASKDRQLPKGVHKVIGDLTDPYSMNYLAKRIQPEVVIHTGALTPVSLSYNMPRAYAETNYIGTINLAEAMARNNENLRLFIYASTSEVYGQNSGNPLKETDPAKPNTPYAVSKYAGELYIREYMVEAYDFPATVIRPFNTYGRAYVRQSHFVIEKLITSMLKGETDIAMGRPDAIRDFVFRTDHVNGYLKLMEAGLYDIDTVQGKVFNISTGKGYAIDEVAEIIAELIGWDGEIWWDYEYRPADIDVLIGDNSRSRNVLKWKPEFDIRSGLERAIDEWRQVL